MTNRPVAITAISWTVAVGMAASAVHLRSAHDPSIGASLMWLAKMGLVKEPVISEPYLAEASIFAVNDANALVFLTATAMVLAGVAMVLAFVAEYRREPTLYLSAGYTCGALALWLYKPHFGFVSVVAGI